MIMKNNVCKICGREYSREYCEFCVKEKRWNPDNYGLMKVFSPLIRQNLRGIDILVKQELVDHLRNNGWLFISGKTGTGKTMLASKYLYEVIRLRYIEQRGPKTYGFVSVIELYDTIRQAMNDPNQSEFEILDYYKNLDILIMDDVGAEKITDWTFSVLNKIVNYRYNYLKSTIFTSNYSEEQLQEERLDDRIIGRIGELSKKIRLSKIYRK